MPAPDPSRPAPTSLRRAAAARAIADGALPRTTLSRRDVLRFGAVGAGALVAGLSGLSLGACGRKAGAPAAATRTSRGLLLGPGGFARPGREPVYLLSVVDLDAWARVLAAGGAGGVAAAADVGPFQIDVDFQAHGLAPDPTQPARVALFEKHGPGACVVDVEYGRVLATIAPTAGREFYGHGAFAPGGEVLYATEATVDDRYEGAVVVRDGRTLEVLGTCPSFGAAPHDCALRDGGATLVVAHGGGREQGGETPCVTYVDVRAGRLLDRVVLDDEAFSAGHVALTGRGDLVVAASPRQWMEPTEHGSVGFRPLGEAFALAREPAATLARLAGECLSVAVHEASGTAAVTCPRAGLVTFWDVTRRALREVLALDGPRGVAVTRDGSHFVMSAGAASDLQLVSTATLQAVPGGRLPSSLMTGSHVMVHDLG